MMAEVHSRAGMSTSRFALFAFGFRPFFLGAGLMAVITPVAWILMYLSGTHVSLYYPGVVWHSHEMIFGYTVAVIAGFLLTAVSNWSGRPTARGILLAALFALWALARIHAWTGLGLPPVALAVIDGLFLPSLALALALPLIRAGQFRNLLFVPLLLVFTVANALVHLELLGVAWGSSRVGLTLALDLVMLLIVIIGGRVIPFFIERAVAGAAPRGRAWLERAVVLGMLAWMVLDVARPGSAWTAAAAGLAAVLNALRLAGWHVRGLWRVPLLWVLWLGYAWLVLGLAMQAAGAGGLVPPSLAVHALTAGAIGVLTLGMMARVALGHTGRAMHAALPTVMAFALVNAAAVARVILPLVEPRFLTHWLVAATVLWVAAFALFLAVYAPMLIQPRVDGRPG